MRLFPTDLVNQGSDLWWDLRRSIVTGSDFDRVLSPIKYKTGAQAKLLADLCGDVAHPADFAPGWVTERLNKPPNLAVENGVAREAESRAWVAMEKECHVAEIGFCLHDSGLFGCSPDGILIADSGCMDAALELKNPMAATHAGYLLRGELPPCYRCQVHGHLIVTGLARCTFCSYCPGMAPLLIDVVRDDFTDRLEKELHAFCGRYLAALDKLGLRKRWEFLRQNTLAHFPPETP